MTRSDVYFIQLGIVLILLNVDTTTPRPFWLVLVALCAVAYVLDGIASALRWLADRMERES